MGRSTLLSRLLRHAVITAGRRLRDGPLRPGWTWRQEIVLDLLRGNFARNAGLPVDVLRKRMDGLSRRTPKGRVVITDAPSGVWLVPTGGVDERVIIYLHGGGYALGSSTSHRPLMTWLAERSRARVYGLDYRLAPEHPCPAALDDVLAAFDYVTESVPEDQVVIAGDSAGGGLTLAALQALRDRGARPAAGVAISPWADLSRSLAPNDADYLDTSSLERWGPAYARELGPTDPRVSPVFGDFSDLPPLGVWAGGAEVLLPDALDVVAAARRDGVDVSLHIEPDEVHVYPFLRPISPAADRGLDQIARFIVAATRTGRGTEPGSAESGCGDPSGS